jgi:hypothetical protein
VFGVVVEGRTYSALFYLLLGFPVALVFWIALVALVATGGGLAITVVGIPLLAATMFGWCIAADLDRLLTNALLRTGIRPLPFGSERNEPWPWRRTMARVRNPYTWRAFAYLAAVRFPMGMAGLVIISLTIGQALHLIFTPVHVAIGFDNQIGPWHLDSTADAAIATPLGLLWVIPSLHIIRWSAALCGKITTAILQSPETDTPQPLAEALDRAATAAVAWPGVWANKAKKVRRQSKIQARIWGFHFGLYLFVMLILLVIYGLATPDTPWVLWPAWGWGIALAMHTGYYVWGHLGGHLLAFAVTNIGFFVIDARFAESTWFFWPLVAWAIALAGHAYLYFGFAPVASEPLLEFDDPNFGPGAPAGSHKA